MSEPPPPIICTVDVVLLCMKEAALHVALLKRNHEPYAGIFALPGGYVHVEEDADTHAAAARMLREKTGIVSPYLEQLGTFSGWGRDPRGWSISVVYFALVPMDVVDLAGHPEVRLVAADAVRGLPFDHQEIVRTAVERVRGKTTYSSLPVHLCGERFTLPQLQAVYEAILGEPINKVSFRRKMDELGILEPIGGAMETGRANRPAQLYRVKPQFRHRLSTTGRAIHSE
jgi:8-oxo-dGTP diphosphatase